MGKSIRKLRHKINLSPYHTGRSFGVNGVMYYCMKKGDVAPTPHICLYLLKYYTCSEWQNKDDGHIQIKKPPDWADF